MLGVTFSYDTIRKYVIAFGNIFNDIYINRMDTNNEVVSTMKIPLNYSPKNKMLNRLKGDPNLDRPVAMTLPRIGFELVGVTPDFDRKLNTIQKLAAVTTQNKDTLLWQYQSIPYNFMFEVSVMVSNAADGTKIIEQILPFFHPDLTITLNLIPELNLSLDIPIVLESVTPSDNYEGDYKDRRVLVWTLVFNLKGYLFGPTKRLPVIKKAITNLYATPYTVPLANVSANNSEHDLTVTITPGLTANGEPTSNASLTIPYRDIKADDNYGFIIEFDRGENE